MNICPRCGRPIPDTAYVCPTCQRELADELRRAAELWPSLEGTVARQARTTGSPVGGHPPRLVIGPACYKHGCDHESCEAIWKAKNIARIEPPEGREDRLLIDLTASEQAWIVANTANAWARHVEDQRGKPIPQRRWRPRQEQLHVIPDEDRPDRCPYSDLPARQCGCGRDALHAQMLHQEKP